MCYFGFRAMGYCGIYLSLIPAEPRSTDPPNHLKLSFSLSTAYQHEPSCILRLACYHDRIADFYK